MRVTSLHRAAERNDAAAVETLLAEGAVIDARDGSGASALLVATHGNRIEAAKALIGAGADVNAKDKIEDSPCLYAGARGHLEILKMTLRHGADLKSTNRYGGTALIPASERGHVETVRTFDLSRRRRRSRQQSGLDGAPGGVILGNGGPRHQQIVALLVKAGADVDLATGTA